MNRAIIIICATILLSIGGFITAFSQDEMLVVDNSDFEKPQRPVALFAHDDHNEMAEIEDCAQCHHLYEDGQLVEDESSEDQYCADCHGPKPDLRCSKHFIPTARDAIWKAMPAPLCAVSVTPVKEQPLTNLNIA